MFKRIEEKFKIHSSHVLFICSTILFLSIFDSIMSYITPIAMVDSGLSDAQMGLIYSSSSFFGLILDFILLKYLKNAHYIVTFLLTGLIGILFPLFMFINPTIFLFILSMFIWGLYYNLWNFARYDFLARESKFAFHVAGASLLMGFHDVGYITGTLVAQPLYDMFKGIELVKVILPFILLSIIFQIPLLLKRKNRSESDNTQELRTSRKTYFFTVIKRLYPLLILGVVMATFDAITWTVTPIIDTVMPTLNNLGGVILAINFLPSFFAYGISQKLANRFGKKRTSIVSFILSSIFLVLLGLFSSPIIYILLSLTASFFIAISYSSYSGAFTDYLEESKSYDSEIISSTDISTNIGYILGPIIGGLLLNLLNSTILFSYIGIFGILIGLIIFLITPKHIPFRDSNIIKV